MGHFPQGPPPGKSWAFLQKCVKSCSTAIYREVHYFVKSVQNSRKNFLLKTEQCSPSGNRSRTSPQFWPLFLLLDGKQNANARKTCHLSSWAPLKKMIIFAKLPKIMPSISLQVVSLFCKKCAKFPKKLFDQNRPIFPRGVQVVYTPHFARYLC